MIKEELIGKIIMTNYGRPRYLKVADLDFTDIATLHILVNNENIPIVEYYSQKYKIKIENMKQPLLLIEDKRRQGGQDQKTYMMPELCLMTGIPEDFDEFRRKKISESTIKSAEHRLTGIKKLMGLISANESEFSSLKNMGIDIKDNLETLEAKVIRPPVLQLGNGSRVEEGK
jgi:aubergine-like protein